MELFDDGVLARSYEIKWSGWMSPLSPALAARCYGVICASRKTVCSRVHIYLCGMQKYFNAKRSVLQYCLSKNNCPHVMWKIYDRHISYSKSYWPNILKLIWILNHTEWLKYLAHAVSMKALIWCRITPQYDNSNT